MDRKIDQQVTTVLQKSGFRTKLNIRNPPPSGSCKPLTAIIESQPCKFKSF